MQLSGALTFANVPTVWDTFVTDAVGKERIDVSAVTEVDSAGLALISALKRAAGPQCRVVGMTSKLATLASAYDVELLF